MWKVARRLLQGQRGFLPFVRIVEFRKAIHVCIVRWFLVNLTKRYSDTFAEFYENFSRFIQNEHIAFQDSRVLTFALFVFLHLCYIAEAVRLEGVQDFDFADGK